MKKHLFKISILIFWAGLMGWWWLDSRAWPPPEKLDAAFLPDYYDYFNLLYEGRKIGWVYKSLRRQSDGAYQAGQGLMIKVNAPGRTVDITASAAGNFDRVLNVLDYNFALLAGPLSVSQLGKVAEDRLTVTTNLGEHGPLAAELLTRYGPLLGSYAELLDFGRPVELPAPAGPLLEQFVAPYLGHLGLKTGRNYSLTILNPFTRGLERLSARVEEEGREYDPEVGREIPVFRARLGRGERSSLVWVDRFGRTVREQALGLELARVDEPWQATGGVEGLDLQALTDRLGLGGPLKDALESAIGLPMGRLSENKENHD